MQETQRCPTSLDRFHVFTAWGASGLPEDVDRLMGALQTHSDIATAKLVDYALSLVATRAGTARIRHYLFNGAPAQRNYAALYFKRRGFFSLLDDALAMGKIDADQAYSK